ncbi:MAG TPA: S-adenosylmethionine:tRNA ribosyltransferase-isomerase [Ktedonobacterales bacterium]|nr:S-adenosylmethionine:tRNA ribosyltransferase-isomerase [Ktedonobacterales bacterium]
MKLDEMEFKVPKELEASAPPEARGQPRDHARLLVIHRDSGQVEHRRFYQIVEYLKPGDVVVLNVSRTVPAALPGVTDDGQEIELRLSAQRSTNGNGGGRIWQAVFKPDEAVIKSGMRLSFGDGALAAVVRQQREDISKLWEVAFDPTGRPISSWLETLGRPIKYDYVPERWGLDYYQTVYAAVPGSAEMPSAGRAFTPELLEEIQRKGVALAQIILHTGVSNIDIETEQVEQHTMYEEWYQVSPEAAETINRARASGGRVVAIGTTPTRALETVTDEQGIVHAGEGWTSLYITPGYRFKAIDVLLTGLHEAKSTRLVLATAFTGDQALVLRAYNKAIAQGYLWHEFGDLSLIL